MTGGMASDQQIEEFADEIIFTAGGKLSLLPPVTKDAVLAVVRKVYNAGWCDYHDELLKLAGIPQP